MIRMAGKWKLRLCKNLISFGRGSKVVIIPKEWIKALETESVHDVVGVEFDVTIDRIILKPIFGSSTFPVDKVEDDDENEKTNSVEVTG